MPEKKAKNVEEYFSGFPADIRQRLQDISAVFHKVDPSVETSIRYGIPAFKTGKEHLYIAGYKNHIGMYPMYGLKELEKELVPFRGKGTKDSLHFPHNKPLPIKLIEKIIVKKSK